MFHPRVTCTGRQAHAARRLIRPPWREKGKREQRLVSALGAYLSRSWPRAASRSANPCVMDGAPPFATPVRAEAPRADELPLVKTEALPPQPPAPKPREAPAAGVVDVEARVAQPMRAAGGVPLGLPFLFVPSPPQPRPPQPQHRQQAAAASDSSMELVLRPMPSRAASLVGRRVAMWRRWHD